MDIYTKFIVTCEKKDKTFLEKILKKKDVFEIWAPCIINDFRDRINAQIYRSITIQRTDEQMEVFGGGYPLKSMKY